MPEVRFTIRWPDGVEEVCYSPSTIVTEYFAPGDVFALPVFMDRARTALMRASDRVQARYGHPCSAAAAQLARIETQGAQFRPADMVRCLAVQT